jgi:hypothetical protein
MCFLTSDPAQRTFLPARPRVRGATQARTPEAARRKGEVLGRDPGPAGEGLRPPQGRLRHYPRHHLRLILDTSR